MKITFLTLVALLGNAIAISSGISNAGLKAQIRARVKARTQVNATNEWGLDFTDGVGGFVKSLGETVGETVSYPFKKAIEGYNWLGDKSPIGCSKAGQTCNSVLYKNQLYECGGHYAKCWKGCCCEDKKAACAVIGHIPDAVPVIVGVLSYCAATSGGCALGGTSVVPKLLTASGNVILEGGPPIDPLALLLEKPDQGKELSREESVNLAKGLVYIMSESISEKELQSAIEAAAEELGITTEKVEEVLRYASSRKVQPPSCARECKPNNKCVLKTNYADSFITRTTCSESNCCSK